MLHYIDLTGFPFDEFNEVDIVKAHISSGKIKSRINKAQKAKLLSKKKLYVLRKYLSGLEEMCLHPGFSDISKTEKRKANKYVKQIKTIISHREKEEQHTKE